MTNYIDNYAPDQNRSIDKPATKYVRVVADNTVVDTENVGFLVFSSNTTTAADATAVLTDGMYPGHMIFVVCNDATNSVQIIPQNGSAGATISLSAYDTATYCWTGYKWVDIAYNDN